MIDIALTTEFAITAGGAMTGADRVIRWSTAGAVVGVAAVASYEHAYALVRAHASPRTEGLDLVTMPIRRKQAIGTYYEIRGAVAGLAGRVA